MDHFLFDLLRWTWDLMERAGQTGARNSETDNSKASHKKAHKAQKRKRKNSVPIVSFDHFVFLSYCFCAFCAFLWLCYSGRSVESEFDEQWMRFSLAAAREAQANGEVPIGTCIVSENKLIALSGNRTRTDCDPTATLKSLLFAKPPVSWGITGSPAWMFIRRLSRVRCVPGR